MKFGRLTVNLAKDSRPDLQEVGTAIPPKAGMLLNGEAIDTAKLKIDDFVKMRKNDGTARALYTIMTGPVLALPFDIKADPDDTDEEQASFVAEALTLPPHKGGMSTPMSLVIADMLRAVLEGYRLFEKVFVINPDGKVVYRKIAPRDNQSITLKMDEHGGFNGARQYAYLGEKFTDVLIPVERCFLFTFGKEMNPLFGESAFIAAYQHYDEKRRLYYLGRLAAQGLSIPPKVATAPSKAKQGQMDGVAQALNNLVGVNSATVLPEGYDLANVNLSNGKFDVLGLINHHNAEMARSVLAHFLMLGTGSSTGSWALSSDQSDMFIMSLKSLVKSLEEHITSYLLPDLINYNFENPKYPKFEFAEMTDGMIAVLKEAFIKILDIVPEGVPDYVIEGIVNKMADQLDIEKPDGAKGKANSIAKKAAAKSKQPVNNSRGDPRFLADDRWARPLNPAEVKVNFAGLENKYNKLEADFAAAIAPIWAKITDDAQAGLEAANAKGPEALASYSIDPNDDYRKLLVQQMTEAYNYAKTGAADELDVKSPATPPEARALIANTAQTYVDKQFNDLNFNIKTAVNDALRRHELAETQFGMKEVLATTAIMFNGFLGNNVMAGASSAIATGVNAGRDTVFVTYENQIDRYDYSAILDRKTCPICKDLDGTVLSKEQYAKTRWVPPIHFHCRCIWVAILKTEQDKPAITGMPNAPGGVTSPPFESPLYSSAIPETASGVPITQPLKDFESQDLETIAQEDIKGRPNAEVNTAIENLLKSSDPAAKRDAIRLALGLPKEDAAAMLSSITLTGGASVGNHFYKVGFDAATGKIARTLLDPTKDPLKMTAEQIAKIVGI